MNDNLIIKGITQDNEHVKILVKGTIQKPKPLRYARLDKNGKIVPGKYFTKTVIGILME